MFRSTTFAASVLTGLFFAALPCVAQEYTQESMEMIKKNLTDKKAILLDVREQKEWDEGNLQHARLLPLSQLKEKGDAKSVLTEADAKSKIIYCHCRAGGRAMTAAKILKEQGYDVRPLKQGYEDLMKGGLPKGKSGSEK
jgi:rhodanese-related sulfurtransferase